MAIRISGACAVGIAKPRFHARLITARQLARVLQTSDLDLTSPERPKICTQLNWVVYRKPSLRTAISDPALSNQAGAIKPATFRGKNARSSKPLCNLSDASAGDRSKNSPSPAV